MTHNQQILEYLKKGATISPLAALNMFGCFRLAARIHDLRKAGHNIRTIRITRSNGTRFCIYVLEKT